MVIQVLLLCVIRCNIFEVMIGPRWFSTFFERYHREGRLLRCLIKPRLNDYFFTLTEMARG